MPTSTFRIISVDPAPSKDSTVFDSKDGFLKLDAFTLDQHLKKARRSDQPVLLAWDAPLTGPWSLDSIPVKEKTDNKRDFNPFYQRYIEKDLGAKFSSGKTAIYEKSKKVVTVLGYAGCSHWAISRAILELPRVGRYCLPNSSLPFALLTKDERPSSSTKGNYVVETHPALAMAMLFKDNHKAELALQRYKSAKKQERLGAIETLKESLKTKLSDFPDTFVVIDDYDQMEAVNAIDDDDHLDAFVGFLLARHWITSSKRLLVEIRGNLEEGAILLPVG